MVKIRSKTYCLRIALFFQLTFATYLIIKFFQMKNLWLMVVATTLFSINVFANGKTVPAKVKTGFEQKFQNAQQVKWGKENATEWEADFTWHGKAYSANFNEQGKWLETEYRITQSEIPAAVKTSLNKEFPGYKITIAEISETSNSKMYEFDLQKGQQKKEVAFDVNGKLKSK
jgi:uncharacterized membrane protein YkoI